MLSQTVLDHSMEPRNMGEFDRPSARGEAGSPVTGRRFHLQLRLEGDQVAEARFRAYPCAAALASGSLLTEWLRGKGLAEAATMTPERLESLLGGLPPHRRHGAWLAVAALRTALADARRQEEHP